MRNLKRALSLILAAAMLIGMMVVGASAAGSLDDFSDRDEIVNQDAVSLLTILGVIEGKEDGSYFDPTGNVTRAEMAKMIATILNQGADVDGLYTGMNTGLTDVAGHWAESYINYCYSLGIIAGRGDGTFDPGATVTGTEAAKMLLVAAGYDASIEGLTGADWAIRTAALASTLGIFDNLTAPTGDPLNRDNAALLVYNALDIEMIQRYENGYAIVFSDYRTLLSNKYGVYRLEGVVVGNEWAQLEETGIDAAMAEGKTRMTDIRLIDSSTVSTRPGVEDGLSRPDTTFNVSTPVDYLGKTVTMYVRNTTVLANSEVLGVYLKDGVNNVVSVNSNNEENRDVLKGTGLSLNQNTQYYVNYGYQASQSKALTELGIPSLVDLKNYVNVNGVEMEIIDNNDDGIVDYVLYTKEDLSVVSSVSTSKETTTLRGFNDNKAIDNEDIVTELELAVDDVVLAITYGGRYYVTAPEVVTGKMDAYSSSKLDNQYIEVNGTEYRPSYIGKLNDVQTSANGVGDIIDFDINRCEQPTGVQFDNTYEFFLDSNGFVRAFRPTDESAPNYALVLNSGYDPGVYATEATGKLTVLLADGTEGTYEINFKDSASNLGKQLYGSSATTAQGVTELKAFMGTDYTDQSNTRPWFAVDSSYVFAHKSTTATDYKAGEAVGYVIKYTLNDNNVMTVQNVIGNIGNYSVNEDDVTNADLSAANIHTLSTVRDALTRAYGTGDARVYYTGNDNIAIDKNTVAFYFEDKDNDRVADDGEYGVATGYDNMANVDLGRNFMASTVVSTTYNTATQKYEYNSTNLADVILFDQANIITARDYAYVLSANRTASNDRVTLNVLFENGEAGTLVVEKSHFDNIFTSNSKFNRAYAYTTNGNGISTLTETTTSMKSGVAYRLKVGTVALNEGLGIRDSYYPYDVDAINIWDVTNASVGENGTKLSDFSTNNWNAILILDTNGKVRTAYVWEYDGSTPGIGGGFDFDWNLSNHGDYVTLYDYHTARDIYEAFDEGKNVLIRGNYTLDSSFGSNRLTIPEGRILYVDGTFSTGSPTKPVTGGGTLWVSGDYANANTSMTVDTQIGGDLVLYTSTAVDSTVAVVGNITDNAAAYTLTVNSDAKVYSEADVVVDTLDVYGHIEAENYDCNNINVYSSQTLIARGNIDVSNALTIGKTGAAGAVTVGGKITGNAVNVVNGTLTMASGNDGISVATVTVDADGAVTANQVDANVTVKAGGKLTADSVTGTVTAEAGAEIDVKDGADAAIGQEAKGEYDFDVTLGENVSVAADKTATFNDTLDSNGKTITLTATSVLELNGKDNVLMNNTISGAKDSKIVFGANATLSEKSDIKLYYKDGTTEVANVAGMTFTSDGSKWVCDVEAPREPEVVKATLSVENATYKIDSDTDVKRAEITTNGTDITITVDANAKDVTFTVSPAKDVSYTKGADTLATSKNGNVFTVSTAKEGYVKLTATGTDMETQTYTITLKIKQ